MSTIDSKQPNQIKEDVTIMETFIKSVLVSNQIIMIIVFIALVYLSNLATKQINDGISEFQSPCIPAGPTGDVGWTRSASGSISTCDISNNSSSPDFVKNLLNDMPSLDLSGNVQTATKIWVGIGISISIILILSPYLLFIPKVIIRGILWIISRISYQFIKNPNPAKLSPEKAYQEQDKIVTEMRDKMWNSFTNFVNLIIPSYNTNNKNLDNKSNNLLKGGSFIEDFLESYAEGIGGDKGDCGNIIRFFIGIIQIVFLLIFSELNTGNSLKITTMLFSFFIALIVIFMILGSLTPDPKMNFIYIVGAIILGIVFFIIKYFDTSTITEIISSVCLILSISLGIYSTTDPSDFEEIEPINTEKVESKKKVNNSLNADEITNSIGKIIKAIGNADLKEFQKVFKKNQYGGGGDKESLGCLINNFTSSIQGSFGFGIAKIIIIILGLVFLPNYNNNSVTKMIQDSYGTPKIIFISIIMLFIILYTLLPWYSLYMSFKNNNDSKIDKIPFYTKACKFISLQICGLDISNLKC